MSKIVCIDAGHYGKYNRAPSVPEYYESQMAWKLHEYLAYELEQIGIKVVKTRTNQKLDLGRQKRGRMAEGCDLFISIHSNAVGSEVNENIDYPLAITSNDGKCDTLGANLAALIRNSMRTKQDYSVKHRLSTATGNEYYGVLLGCTDVGVSGLILEHSFHTNTASAKWLLDDNNLRKLAYDEAKIIAQYLGVDCAENGNSNKFDANLSLLAKGDSGDNVKALQILLIGRGYSCGKKGADGIFGVATKDAVIAYQKAKNLVPDGVVGVDTMTSLLGY